MVRECCSGCYPALLGHLMMRERAATQSITGLFFFFKRVDRTESSKEPEPVPSTSGMSEIAGWPPFPIADDPSALSSPTPSLALQSVILLACSLNASLCMPAVVLYYYAFQGTVRLKMFCLFLYLFFMYYVCEKDKKTCYSTVLL